MAKTNNLWNDVSKPLVDNLKRHWGRGWYSLGKELRRALAMEAVLYTCMGWRNMHETGLEFQENIRELQRSVRDILDKEE